MSRQGLVVSSEVTLGWKLPSGPTIVHAFCFSHILCTRQRVSRETCKTLTFLELPSPRQPLKSYPKIQFVVLYALPYSPGTTDILEIYVQGASGRLSLLGAGFSCLLLKVSLRP